ncbi:conserved hypothetical protein [Culex quinquefasciatus]|uniref:Uncharacterized protein n=1 Tax=Culex quinquefasciatus TaxID=7176 RepID=B0WE02_CULQU|nr:conserved hypothetical protein [Culex quinquefasciatus]|eukprot:XP_001846936.1 conserved hypothetical protein [Culex quinquefasciatus]
MPNAAAGTGFRCRGARGERKLAIHYVFVYVFCLQIVATTNDRMSSTLWKLNAEQGKIVSVPTGGGGGSGRDDFTLDELAERLGEPDEDEESTFSIITATAANYRHNTWNRGEGTTEELLRRLAEGENPSSFGANSFNATAASPVAPQPSRSGPSKPGDPSLDLLTCGKPVNFTHYDDLVGVAQRYEHNPAPEPEVAYLFLKRKTGQSLEHFNIDALERRLRRAKKEQPHTIALWNQIGNFWRIKGNAGHAIECFRRALSVAPTNADTLLNLARVLFNLQYLDDAISLTKRSLESLFVMLMVTVMLRTRASGHSHCGGGSSAAISITNISNAGGYPDGGLGGGGGGDDGSDTNNNNNNNNNNNGLGPIINSFSLANFRPAKHFNRAQAMRSLRSVAFRSFRPFRYRK